MNESTSILGDAVKVNNGLVELIYSKENWGIESVDKETNPNWGCWEWFSKIYISIGKINIKS